MSAYSTRYLGSVVTSSSGGNLTPSPGVHNTNYFTGDLLLLYTAQRSGGESTAEITGWTKLVSLYTNGSLEVWGRVADGGANDSPTVDWSGTSACIAVIDVWQGDVYTDLSTIVAAYNTENSSGNATAVIPALSAAGNGFSTNDCLVIAVSRKNKTVTSNDNTFTAPSPLTERLESVITGVANALLAAYIQQTTQTDIADTNWTKSGTDESLATNAIIFALKTQAATTKKLKVLVHSAAQSDSGVAGVVFEAPDGSDITGAKIGEFTGKSFEASLEGGLAVLKVPVSEFGGAGLTTSDTPVVFLRNATDGLSDIIFATVIQE